MTRKTGCRWAGTALVLVAMVLIAENGEAQAYKDLRWYGWALGAKMQALAGVFRTILFFVLVFGLLWFVAMFVSGRPAIKPIVTCVIAAVLLGGIQVVLNTFINTKADVDMDMLELPSDMLQY